jgi:hypothetical protein
MPINLEKLLTIKSGDVVTRLLGGEVPMNIRVTDVTDDRIICGAWEFDRGTGMEIDEQLGWTKTRSGSCISAVLPHSHPPDAPPHHANDCNCSICFANKCGAFKGH